MTDKTCYRCNGKGIVPGDAGEYDSMPCPECTGERQHDLAPFHEVLMRRRENSKVGTAEWALLTLLADATKTLIGETGPKAATPKLPTFDELQEGDWIRVRPVDKNNDEFDHEGYFAGIEGEDFYTRVPDGRRRPATMARWRIVAFKPLRQVVEEMAAKVTCSPVEIENTGFGCHIVMCSFGAARALKVVHPDERTALLAAKAALEVMIARKGKS